MGKQNIEQLLEPAVKVAVGVGQVIRSYCLGGKSFEVNQKANQTVVTTADIEAHHYCVAGLKACYDVPILSEEGNIPPIAERAQWTDYWLVDPLDGSQGLVDGSCEVAVCIALIRDGRPSLAVIHDPINEVSYSCVAGGAVWQQCTRQKQRLASTKPCSAPMRFVMGHYTPTKAMGQLLAHYPGHQINHQHSALKFIALLQGQSDIYVRTGPISEWDVAAGDLLISANGGKMVDFHGAPMHYNCRTSLHCPAFVAARSAGIADDVLKYCQTEDEL